MSIREEQCNKVCRILDDVLANRPTERDSLIVAVRKAFEALELFGNSEPLPSAQPERKKGRWIKVNGKKAINCSACYHCSWSLSFEYTVKRFNFCPNCGADMREEKGSQDG